MSKREQFNNQVKKYSMLYDLYHNQYYAYVNSKDYTEEFLKKKHLEIIESYKSVVQKHTSDLLALVDTYVAPYKDTTVKDLKDADYQVGLNNLLNAIKSGVIEQESLDELEKSYRTNKMAIGLLQKACEQKGLVFNHVDPMTPYNKLRGFIEAFGDINLLTITDDGYRRLWISEYIGIVEEHTNKYFNENMSLID